MQSIPYIKGFFGLSLPFKSFFYRFFNNILMDAIPRLSFD